MRSDQPRRAARRPDVDDSRHCGSDLRQRPVGGADGEGDRHSRLDGHVLGAGLEHGVVAGRAHSAARMRSKVQGRSWRSERLSSRGASPTSRPLASRRAGRSGRRRDFRACRSEASNRPSETQRHRVVQMVITRTRRCQGIGFVLNWNAGFDQVGRLAPGVAHFIARRSSRVRGSGMSSATSLAERFEVVAGDSGEHVMLDVHLHVPVEESTRPESSLNVRVQRRKSGHVVAQPGVLLSAR